METDIKNVCFDRKNFEIQAYKASSKRPWKMSVSKNLSMDCKFFKP